MSEQASEVILPAEWPEDTGQRVRALRRERGESGEAFGQLIGLSKGKVSELEAGKFTPSATVALAIETLSEQDGRARIDAAELCEDVRRARYRLLEMGPLEPAAMALVFSADHDGGSIPGAAGTATGLNGDLSGGVEA